VQGSNISSGCPAPRDDAGTSTQIIDQGRSLLCVKTTRMFETQMRLHRGHPQERTPGDDPAADDLDRAGRGRYTGSPALTPSRLSDYPLVKEQCERLLSLRPNPRGSSVIETCKLLPQLSLRPFLAPRGGFFGRVGRGDNTDLSSAVKPCLREFPDLALTGFSRFLCLHEASTGTRHHSTSPSRGLPVSTVNPMSLEHRFRF